MKKRSAYKPKPVRLDAHLHLITGFLPLRKATQEMQRLRIVNHGAMERVVSGKASYAEAAELLGVFSMAVSLAKLGVGSDWTDEFEQARAAVYALILRGNKTGRFVFTGPELTAANLALEVHNLQLDNCTIEVFEKAIKLCKTYRKETNATPV